MYQKKQNAYLISAHLDPNALAAQVNSLNSESQVDFYIHIDAKVNITPFKTLLNDYSNVIFLEGNERVIVHWGGYSQLKMQYNLMQKMFDSGTIYKRVFNLSGLDYPLVSNKTLLEKLPNDKEYITGYDVSHERYINPQKGSMKDKFLYYHFMDTRFLSRLNKLKIKKKSSYEQLGYDFYFGSENWSLTYDCVKYIFDTYSKDKALQKILRFCFSPNEAWVHTIFFNSCWRNKGQIYQDEYHGLIALSPVHYFSYGDSIKILTEEDYDTLIQSGKMFCRKVRSGISDKLISMIETKRQGNA